MAQQQGVIIIEKMYGGWATDLSGANGVGNSKTVEGGPQEYGQSSSVMLNRPGYEGHLTPGPLFTSLTDSGSEVNALPNNAIVLSNGTALCVLENGRIVTWTLNGVTITAGSSHDPTGATLSGNCDILLYPSQLGTPPTNNTDEYVFYSYDKTTNADVGLVKKSAPTSYTDNYLSGLAIQNNGSALIVGVPHPLLMGQDNNVYVGNGRFLASHDPTTTSVNYQGLDLKPGWTIIGLTSYQFYIAILAYKTSTRSIGASKSLCKMFLWDGFSPTWNQEFDLKDNYASNIYSNGVDLYVLTYGSSATTKVKRFNGYGFDVLFESAIAGIPPGSTVSNSPCIGGTDIWLNHFVWTTNGNSQINAYGSPNATKYPEGYHRIGNINSANGMCRNLNGNVLFVGNKVGSTYSIKYSDLTAYDTSAASSWRSCLYTLPTNSSIDGVKIWYSQFGGKADIQYALVKDYNVLTFPNTSTTNTFGWEVTTLATSQGTNVLYGWNPVSLDNVNSFYLGANWVGGSDSTQIPAFIRRIEIPYRYDDANA